MCLMRERERERERENRNKKVQRKGVENVEKKQELKKGIYKVYKCEQMQRKRLIEAEREREKVKESEKGREKFSDQANR